jgi:integrase
LPVAQIDTPALIQALRPMWERTPTTASRVRGRIEAILDWATVSGFRQGENPARWTGHLEHLLPPARKLAPIVHHEAMGWRDVPGFMAELCQVNSTVARVLELVVLTAARSGEVRGMTWGEVNLDTGVWIVPANRMKAGSEHRVPLASRAIAILKEQRRGSRKGLVFSGRGGVQVSDSALRYLLKTLGQGDVTVHGFRSAFRDWAGESTGFAREVAEAALAHRVGNAVERAYRRGDALEKRHQLMNAWAEFCGPVPEGATVTRLHERAVR